MKNWVPNPGRTDTELFECRISDNKPPAELTDFTGLANRTADKPLEIPKALPAYTRRSTQNRYAETSVYPTLEASIDASVMEFSQEPIPNVKSQASVRIHGPGNPFRHHTVINRYVEDLLNRKGYQDLVEYNTTVERAEKLEESSEWRLTLRKKNGVSGQFDYWWTETLDSIVVASGHYTVPYVPHINGLAEFAQAYPGSVEHTKGFRGVDRYRGKVTLLLGSNCRNHVANLLI